MGEITQPYLDVVGKANGAEQEEELDQSHHERYEGTNEQSGEDMLEQRVPRLSHASVHINLLAVVV